MPSFLVVWSILALYSIALASTTVHSLAPSTISVIDFNTATGATEAVSISKSIASLSIEFCYITDYFGDVGKPNHLTLQLLQNIQDILGAPPVIRIGGHTQDAAQYDASNPETLTNIFEPGNLEAVNVTFNSGLFQVLNENVVSGQQFILGLNFGQDDVAYPLAEVVAAESLLQSTRLYAYELGNEPDFYSASQRPPPWNVEVYAQQQLDWILKLQTKTRHSDHGFQLAAFAQEPIYMGNLSLAEFTTLGVPKVLGDVKSYSDHTYPYSVCSDETAALVSLPNLMDHIDTIQYFSQWQAEVASAKLAGVPFHMGETGSVSCHGKDGVSNTLGAALWELDYMLHGATLGFEGVYFHMGTPFYYSMWQPVAYNNTPASVYPTYYSLLFIADLVGDILAPTILELSAFESSTLAAYAIYNGNKLSKIAVLNLEFYNDTMTERPTQAIDVSAVLGKSLRVTRLTGPLSITTSVENVTWAGQTYANGDADRIRATEYSNNGMVEVAASEAVIIQRYLQFDFIATGVAAESAITKQQVKPSKIGVNRGSGS